MSDPRELRQLSAFFAWTAWASAATRPGTSHSYTNNFPYEPLAGNTLTGSALIFSALSIVFLLGGTAAVLLAFGKFDYLGWHRREAIAARATALPVSDAQRATLKFMAIAALMFFGQTMIGGGVAHYRADPVISTASISPNSCPATCYALGISGSQSYGSLPLMSAAPCSSRACWAAASARGNAALFTCCSALSSWSLSGAWGQVGWAPLLAGKGLVLVRQPGLGIPRDRPLLANTAGDRARLLVRLAVADRGAGLAGSRSGGAVSSHSS